jgi:hypothetical protein
VPVAGADVLSLFLFNKLKGPVRENLELFCMLDDTDVISSIKLWSRHPDPVLSLLCNSVLNRNLFKVRLQSGPIEQEMIKEKRRLVADSGPYTDADIDFLVFTGEAVTSLYNPYDERINILFKDGQIRDISMVDNALIHQKLSEPVRKFYLCFHKPE